MTNTNGQHIAVSDAPKGKGGTSETARPIQDLAMLKVAEKPVEGNYLTVAHARKLYRLHNAAVHAMDRLNKAKSNRVAEAAHAKYEQAEEAFMAGLEAVAPIIINRETGWIEA